MTEVGGDVVAIEVTRMEGREDFILTGQLGEVMRESARAGLSWTRAHARELGIPREVFEKNTLHIHVPAGGIPKDGPSAGITMATAIVSALTGIPVRKDVAMTGEITLRGRVLPIGGLKSKILAAHLSGAKIVILPRKNEKDLRDIPEEIRKSIKLILVDTWTRCSRRPFGASRRRSSPSRPRSSRATTRIDPEPGARPRPPDGLPADRPAAGRGPGLLTGASRTMAGSGPGSPGLEYKDYYAVLGVPRTASQAEIKKAFRKLARQHHPDAKPGDTAAERRFKEVNEANEVLVRPRQAQAYDELGANWDAIGQARPRRRSVGRRAVRRLRRRRGGRRQRPLRVPHDRRRRRVLRLLPRLLRRGRGRGAPARPDPVAAGARPAAPTFEDILAGMGLDGRDGRRPTTGGAGPARPRRSRRPRPSPRSRLEEAYHGTTRLVDVEGKRLEVTIPPGADTGTRVRLTGKAPGRRRPVRRRQASRRDAVFTRRGADLERELPLTLEEALLGAEVPVETLKGQRPAHDPGRHPGRDARSG